MGRSTKEYTIFIPQIYKTVLLCNSAIKCFLGFFSFKAITKRGAMVEWSEQLGYGAESRRKVVSLRLGFPCDDWKTLCVNPAVNGYLFRIREG